MAQNGFRCTVYEWLMSCLSHEERTCLLGLHARSHDLRHMTRVWRSQTCTVTVMLICHSADTIFFAFVNRRPMCSTYVSSGGKARKAQMASFSMSRDNTWFDQLGGFSLTNSRENVEVRCRRPVPSICHCTLRLPRSLIQWLIVIELMHMRNVYYFKISDVQEQYYYYYYYY